MKIVKHIAQITASIAMNLAKNTLFLLLILAFTACNSEAKQSQNRKPYNTHSAATNPQNQTMNQVNEQPTDSCVIAGGCFWCTEAVFRDVIGVSNVESGYIGGTKPNPTYKEVCTGETGHAEGIRVTFDPHAISLAEIYDVFLGTHDPTQLNRQGGDIGTQYRSAIFPLSDEQAAEAEAAIARCGLVGKFKMRHCDVMEPAKQGGYDHLACVSLFTDPESYPWLSAVAYGRIAPVQLQVEAFVAEREKARGLAAAMFAGLQKPGLITTTVEEVAWFVEECEKNKVAYAPDEETLPTAVVGDPIGFMRIG